MISKGESIQKEYVSIKGAKVSKWKCERRIISEGICICIYGTAGEKRFNCLEGFDYNCEYKYQKMKDKNGIYYRMYNEEHDPYYETCSHTTFRRCFRILTENKNE